MLIDAEDMLGRDTETVVYPAWGTPAGYTEHGYPGMSTRAPSRGMAETRCPYMADTVSPLISSK